MVYMLCGYWKWETWDDILYRFKKMVAIGLMPYPMVYMPSDGNSIRKDELKKFQRWAIRRCYQFVEWEVYKNENERSYYARHLYKILQFSYRD